jgi:hypothetical protein
MFPTREPGNFHISSRLAANLKNPANVERPSTSDLAANLDAHILYVGRASAGAQLDLVFLRAAARREP